MTEKIRIVALTTGKFVLRQVKFENDLPVDTYAIIFPNEDVESLRAVVKQINTAFSEPIIVEANIKPKYAKRTKPELL